MPAVGFRRDDEVTRGEHEESEGRWNIMAAMPPVWDVPATGGGDVDVVAFVLALSALAGCAIASFLTVRRTGQREGSLSVDGSTADAPADREPAIVA
jgi:hypothetical protein